MKKFFLGVACGCVLAISVSFSADAALVSRLSGAAVYDTELNVTWAANANLAASNTFGVGGILSDGSMSWNTAQSWIGAMNTAGYLGYSDWRLPAIGPVNGTAMNFSNAYNGTTDVGYNISAPGTTYAGSLASEMARLFYHELGNNGLCDPAASTASFCASPQPGWDVINSGPFSNVQSGSYVDPDWGVVYKGFYWLGLEYPLNTAAAMHFSFGTGSQGATDKLATYYVWAVRTGDVSAVPAPTAFWLFASGLAGLIGFARKATVSS
jgi:hypothetical protein